MSKSVKRIKRRKDPDKMNAISRFILGMGIVLNSIGLLLLFITVEIISYFKYK